MGGPVADVASKLEAKAASFAKENRLPGAAVGVVQGDDLVWAAGVGFADVATRRAPERQTLYRIASITKTITGTAIMQLRDEGKLHLDDPAVEYLPELREAQSSFGPIETVTIRRMLSHESGLMSEPPGTDWRAPRYEGSVKRNFARVAEIGTKIPPNAQQKYSNLAYQLLGEIVARTSKTLYVEYVRTAILEPLGMTASAFEPLPDAVLSRRATGYAGRFLSDELDLASIPPTIWAEGGLWSCVEDLARWLSFQFREDGGARKGAQVLAGSSLKEMHAARYIGNDDWTEAWCISWYARRRENVIWVQHSGGLHGFITNVCFDPKNKVGAIALLNGIGDAPALAMDLATIARDAILGAAPRIEPRPHYPRPIVGCWASTPITNQAGSSGSSGATGSCLSSIPTMRRGGRHWRRQTTPTFSSSSPGRGSRARRRCSGVWPMVGSRPYSWPPPPSSAWTGSSNPSSLVVISA